MKTNMSILVGLALFACMSLQPFLASAQTFNQFVSFDLGATDASTGWYTNSDGAYSYSELISGDDFLFGTTSSGGAGGSGTVFKVNTNGTGFVVLKSFAPLKLNTSTGRYTNSDGAVPHGKLFLSENTLYGTATEGGDFGMGAIFKLDTDGGSFTVIKHFVGGSTDGSDPEACLQLPDNILYGTTQGGGSVGEGILFKIDTNGGGFSIVHNFNSSPTNGVFPRAELVRQGSTFYGTTYAGGASGWGTVFKMNTNGTGYTVVKSFSDATPGTNSDGASPEARLVLSGGVLYGTTLRGGAFSNGTIFKVNTDSTELRCVLKTFAAGGQDGFGSYTNADGANPSGRLVLSIDTLYGTTQYGGAGGAGTIFKINTNGNGFVVVRSFEEVNGFGGVLMAGLLLVDDTFFRGNNLWRRGLYRHAFQHSRRASYDGHCSFRGQCHSHLASR